MRFYYVDPPVPEEISDGEEIREWFTSRRAAERVFNECQRELNEIAKARIEAEKLEDVSERMEAFNNLERYKFDYVEMGVADVETNRKGILHILNRRVLSRTLKKYTSDRRGAQS